MSKPFLSRLEAGDRRPSIAAVLTLARVFEISVGALFDEPQMRGEPCVIVRGESATTRLADGLRYSSLSNSARFSNLQPMRVTISADRTGNERFQHEGEEWVYVIEGILRLLIGVESHTLHQGDAAHFDSRVSHRLEAVGETDVEVIVVACPLSEAPALPPEDRPRFKSRRAVG